ncbi:hypothetical protein Dimus_030762 [Dionaea muscipula]
MRMDFTRPVSSRTRAKQDLLYKTLFARKKKKTAKEDDGVKGHESAVVNVEGEFLGLGFDGSASVTLCNGSNEGGDAEEIEGVGSFGSAVKSGALELKKGKGSEIVDVVESICGSSESFGGGKKLGLKKGGKSKVGSGKSNNAGEFDQVSCTKSQDQRRSDVGVEEIDNVGGTPNVGNGRYHDLDGDDHGGGSDEEVQVLGKNWRPYENGDDHRSTINLETSSGSELESDVENEAVTNSQIMVKVLSKPNCVKQSIPGNDLALRLDREGDKACSGCKDVEDEEIRVSCESSRSKDSSSIRKGENVVFSDSFELDSSSKKDDSSGDMDYEMDDSVRCEQSDLNKEEGRDEEDDDEEEVGLMEDRIDDFVKKRKRVCGLEVLVNDAKGREEGNSGGEDDELNCVALRTRSRYQPTIPRRKLKLFGTISHPFLIDDDLILSSPEHEEEEENDRDHGGYKGLNAVKHRGRKSGRGNRENVMKSGYEEDKVDTRECYSNNALNAEKHGNNQFKSSGKRKLDPEGGRVNDQKENEEECDDEIEEEEEDDRDHAGNIRPCRSDQLKTLSENLQKREIKKGGNIEVPRKRRCVSGLKDYDVHQILLNSIMGSGELDTILDGQGVAEKMISMDEELLQWKFTFGTEPPETSVESEVDEELDNLWKELDLCLATSVIDSSDSCWGSSEQELHPGTGTDRESLCDQGKHQLVLDEEIGLVCKFCSHVNLEIKHIMSPFNKNPFGKSESRDSYRRVADNVLDNPLFEGFGCSSPESRHDPDFHQTGTVWDIIPGIKKGMYPHQVEGFEFLWRNIGGSIELDELREPMKLSHGGCIISHAPGTGKTRLAIVFLLSYMKLYSKTRPVIIAPCNMLLSWEEEFRKWNVDIPFHNLNANELSGKEDTRVLGLLKRYRDTRKVRLAKLFSWERNESILGLSYRLFEQLTDTKDHDGPKKKKKSKQEMTLSAEKAKVRTMLLKLPGLLVLDEGHIPRNDGSQIFRNLTGVGTKKRIILSGTPFQNSLAELYNTLCLVRPQFPDMILSGKVPEDPPNRRRRKRAKKGKRAFLYTMDSDVRLEELRVKMKPFVHLHKGDVLKTLPGIRDMVVVLQPSGLQRKLLEQCQERCKRGIDMDHMIALISLHPCLSTCFSEKKDALFDRTSLEKVEGDTSAGVKTRFLMELIRLCKALGEKVLVFSQFIDPLEFIIEKLESQLGWRLGQDMLFINGELLDRKKQSMMSLFNDPSSTVKVLLASTKACSEGISLVGASRVVLLDTVWNPATERQAIGRAYRIGQKRVVHVYHLLISKTYEEEKHRRQIEKGRLSKLLFSLAHRENEEANISAQVSEDKILEKMVQSEKLKYIFEKIYPLGFDSDLLDSFDWVNT